MGIFPLFKRRGWFDTPEFAEFSGVTLDGRIWKSACRQATFGT